MGNVKGVFLVVVFAVFMALLLRMAVKQKNRLGYMLSIGCVIFLILQSLFYIGVNAGLYPISGNYMPFLSHGNMTMMITYFYMGNTVVRVPEYQRREKLVDNIEKGIYHIKHIGKERKVCEKIGDA